MSLEFRISRLVKNKKGQAQLLTCVLVLINPAGRWGQAGNSLGVL